jgi:hypothetical protein
MAGGGASGGSSRAAAFGISAWIWRRKREGGDVERGVIDSSYTKCH